MTLATGAGAMEHRYLKTFFDVLALGQSLREGAEDKVWIRVLEKLSVTLDAEAGTYFLVGVKGRELIPYYSLGVPPEKLSQVPIPMGQGICGWVAVRREPLLVEDAYKDSRFMTAVDEATGFKTRSVLCIPIMDRLDLAGVLEILNRRDRPFNEDDLRFVEAVCQQVSLNLRLVRLEAMLNKVTAHNASILENLTGGFLAVDLRARVIICNPAAKRILELGDDALNLPVDQALRHLPALAEVLMKTLATKQIAKRQDLRWSYRDQPRLLGYSTLLIQDAQNNFTGVGITFQDLTSVKK
ncbi:MAG: GAF domain-containing protein [Elusimicrobia bacterium]|nr:GAF domain-containing protein [Elusimicrobiota bacterium]